MRAHAWQRRAKLSIFQCMNGLRRKRADGDTALRQRIAGVLGDMAPLLRIDHCRIEIADYAAGSGHLAIRIHGTCPDCTGSPAMFATAIEAHVRQRVPEVRLVRILE
jgi:Fe-S cluster biogenesis protein NfuA